MQNEEMTILSKMTFRLAKNAAVEQGGNTIYRIDHPEDGKGNTISCLSNLQL